MKISNIFSRKNCILLRELIVTDFKLRYQGSALGYLWSLLKPLMLFAILYVVFVHFLRFGSDVPHYPVYLLLGVVLWSFFTEATNQGMQAIVSRGDLIRKINFPKYIIIISGTISALINLVLNLLVVFIFALVNGVNLNFGMLFIILNILELYLFSLSIAFLLGASYVKYRDIAYIWEVLLQGLFYTVPIIYPISMIIVQSPVVAKILLLNPVAQVIQDARYNLITNETITANSLINNVYISFIPYIIVLIFMVVGILYFRKNSKYFAEKV